ncbi:MAG TPA: hypothetical protein VNN17_03550 [Terriglobia bacterium]|nr:hypothetical protein [Terriglobia bacterium]
MKSALPGRLLGAVVLFCSLAAGHEIPIETPVQYRLENGQVLERPIALVFDDFHFQIRDRQSREVVLTIRYAEISRMKYEKAGRPEVLEGHPLPASAAWQHWLTVYYPQQAASAYLLLALDEYDHDTIVSLMQMLSEKAVEGAPGTE